MRFAVHSTLDVPLIVDASDPFTALRLGFQLLERESRLGHVLFDLRHGGMLVVSDVERNEHYAVVRVAFGVAAEDLRVAA